MAPNENRAVAGRADVYARVTDKIVADLERGVRSWLQPWNADYAAGRVTRPLRHNGEAYRGINVVMLWASAVEQGFACPYWMSYRQAQELGGQVRKGEKGTVVAYANKTLRKEAGEDGEEKEREVFFMRGYAVFNAEQIDGLPDRYRERAAPVPDPVERIERADAFFSSTGADVRHGGTRAYYALQPDYVRMPPFETFRDAESYAATLGHELVHWTRHPSRLDRDLGRKRFGDAGYALEELVAELGTAFVCADLAITPEPREDRAAYIASWLEVLKNDKRAIFTAASHAQRAADYLHGLQGPAASG